MQNKVDFISCLWLKEASLIVWTDSTHFGQHLGIDNYQSEYFNHVLCDTRLKLDQELMRSVMPVSFNSHFSDFSTDVNRWLALIRPL